MEEIKLQEIKDKQEIEKRQKEKAIDYTIDAIFEKVKNELPLPDSNSLIVVSDIDELLEEICDFIVCDIRGNLELLYAQGFSHGSNSMREYCSYLLKGC